MTHPPAHRLIRFVRWTRMTLHLLQGLLVTGLIYPRIAPGARARITQLWSIKMLCILNISLIASGAKPEVDSKKLFLVANHVSWLDIFVINATHPSRFVAKSEIRDWPIAGWLCEAAGTIFVRRTKRSDTTRINAIIHDVLDSGDTVAIFPEGTTTLGDRLLKFHTSLFEPAVVNQAIVTPAAIRYCDIHGTPSAATVFVGNITFSQSISAIIAEHNLQASITFAPGIPTAGINRREAAEAAENAIADILNVPKSQSHQRFGDGTAPLALQAGD